MVDSHKDLEFQVGDKVFKKMKDAVFHAFVLCATGQSKVEIDVVIWSKAAARVWSKMGAGEDFLQEYEDDPEMSVANRFVIKGVDDQGIVR